MAKAKSSGGAAGLWKAKPKKRRPGVHAKKKNSVNKTGKHYQKKNRGQGTRR